MPRKALVTDFDGTMTKYDFYERALAYVGADGLPDYWHLYESGQVTHFEAMAGIFRHVRCSPSDMETILQSLEPDPKLSDAVHKLQKAGWDILVVSAGSSWYIDRIFQECKIEVQVHASPGRFSPDEGLVMTRPVDSPFYSQTHGIDKVKVMEYALESYDVAAFAGNGPPDLEPALRSNPELRFARSWLADELTRLGEPFEPFEIWPEISKKILER